MFLFNPCSHSLTYIKVPSTLEIGVVPVLKGGQYPGLYIMSTPARMVRPVLNLSTNTTEMIGSFEQVSHYSLHYLVTVYYTNLAQFIPFCIISLPLYTDQVYMNIAVIAEEAIENVCKYVCCVFSVFLFDAIVSFTYAACLCALYAHNSNRIKVC